MHPLIDAIRNKNKIKVLEILNNNNKNHTTKNNEKDKYNRSPLFYAIIMKYNYKEVIQKIIDINPTSVKEKDKWGDYKLFTALRYNCTDVNLINRLVEIFPNACMELDSQNLYAFSIAIMIKKKHQVTPTSVIKCILKHSDIENICSHYMFNRSPLAYALKYLISYISLEIFIIIVNNSPIKYLNLKDIENIEPIKRALTQTNQWENDDEQAHFLQTLINKSNNTIKFDEEDEYGRTILHFACLHKVGVKAINVLINAHPKMLIERDREGRLPLHIAIRMYIYTHTFCKIYNKKQTNTLL